MEHQLRRILDSLSLLQVQDSTKSDSKWYFYSICCFQKGTKIFGLKVRSVVRLWALIGPKASQAVR